MANTVKNFEELPLVLNIDQMADVLGISKRVAYRVAKSESLSVRVGEKRLIVPKSKLIAYLNRQ